MDKFDVTSAGRKIESFVDDLSNWYVRRCRKRYWAGDMTEDKVSAYLTLHETLVTKMCIRDSPCSVVDGISGCGIMIVAIIEFTHFVHLQIRQLALPLYIR